MTDALPEAGLLCIEASAGTGKTHQLSTLATRWVVERDDLRIADVLVVTYTIAAAAELRGRIRERLVEVRDRLAPQGTTTSDEYLEWLAAQPEPLRARERAVRALAEFDTATISTIHAFASGALGESRGTLGRSHERRLEAVTDVLTAEAFDPTTALWDVSDVTDESLGTIVGLGLEHPDLTLTPLEGADASPGSIAFRDTARRAIELVGRRQRAAGALTFADLLTELDDAIARDDAPLLRSLRERYRVGLIDEFQDTDAVQWRIFRRLFLERPDATLVVVGDPKQAIYGFRGADVDTYLAARDEAAASGHGVSDLDTNWRSDEALLDALNALYDGARFDEPGRISYRKVRAAPDGVGRRFVVPDGAAVPPLSLRIPVHEGTMASLRASIADECAEEARRALDAGVRAADGTVTALTPNDIVVLCATRYTFGHLKEAFHRRGIRLTETRSDDVLASPAALQVEVALRAMADPGDTGALAAFEASLFGPSGTGAERTAAARGRLVAWREALDRRGVLALARSITDPAATPGLLSRRAGERLVTDVQHVFELLDAAAPPQCGAVALLETLQEMRLLAMDAGDDQTRARRIETDEPAVRLMTVHGAKGLEFGVVLCPFIQRTRYDEQQPTIWRDNFVTDRLVDAGGGEDWTDERLAAPRRKDRHVVATAAEGGESRRLQYVALTRAKHRCVVWWLAAWSGADRQRDELSALLFDRDDEHAPVQRPRTHRDGVACYHLAGAEALAAARAHLSAPIEGGLLEVRAVGSRSSLGGAAVASAEHDDDLAEVGSLGVATLRRSLRARQRRCSFSSLVSDDHVQPSLDAALGDAGADDEGPADVPAAIATDAGSAPVFDGLRGTAFGSAVHEALEAALGRAGDETFVDALGHALPASLQRHGLAGSPTIVTDLVLACSVPLPGGRAIRDLEPDAVRTELRFAMPIAAGLSLDTVATELASLESDGPFAGWAADLATSSGRRALADSLVGSIDLIAALGDDGRYSVLDYKTNVCDDALGYVHAGLEAAMRAADYPLQATIYLVALHRLLRWRLADYDPDAHLGGAHYLFLRGMRPGSSDGIYSWRPAPAAIARLSDVLAGVS